MTVIYKDLIADDEQTRQVTADVIAALALGRNCLVLTNWTTHLDNLATRSAETAMTPSCCAEAWAPGKGPPR
jgi:hypothetical protein